MASRVGLRQTGSTISALVAMASLVVIIAGLRVAQPIVVPFLLAVFIAVALAPALFWLRRLKVPTLIAIALICAVLVGIFSGIGALVGTSIEEFSRGIPVYQEKLKSTELAVAEWLGEQGAPLPEDTLDEYLNLGELMRYVGRFLGELGGVFTNAFFIFIAVVFMLLEAASFPEKLRASMGDSPQLFRGLDKFSRSLNRYLVMKTLISTLTGVLVALFLTIMELDYPALWGLVAFLLNYIPTIGSIIAAIPAVLLALIQLNTGAAAIIALAYLVINVTIGNIAEPRLMGKGLGLSTSVVFFSLVFWGWVLGLVGTLLSVPLTMTAKIALEGRAETRWLAILLGPEKPEPHSG